MADRVLPLVLTCAAGKRPDDLPFTTRSGHQLQASVVKRSSADRAGLERLNAPGCAGGAPDARSGE
ncbi:MAG TPA: hypothetical protein VFK52_07325 [Nocardioidaceae bacterium]|nr:hypothetical protein [Nocardioidaceae bacterium]